MFLDCSSLLAENPPRPSNGIAVTDIDGDGAFELVVAGYRTANLVLKWVDGRLVDIATPLIAAAFTHLSVYQAKIAVS